MPDVNNPELANATIALLPLPVRLASLIGDISHLQRKLNGSSKFITALSFIRWYWYLGGAYMRLTGCFRLSLSHVVFSYFPYFFFYIYWFTRRSSSTVHIGHYSLSPLWREDVNACRCWIWLLQSVTRTLPPSTVQCWSLNMDSCVWTCRYLLCSNDHNWAIAIKKAY